MNAFLDRVSNLSPAEKICGLQTAAALVGISATALFAAVKFRLVHEILPPSMSAKLDEMVDRLAEMTAPSAGTSMEKARPRISFLQRTYIKASFGFLIGGLGTLAWVKQPLIPIAPACIVCSGTFLAQAILSKKLTTMASNSLFVAAAFSGGVALGPLNYIASQAFSSAIFSAALATTVSWTIAPMLTRGWLANAFVAQALSSSLCYVATKAIVLNTYDNVNNPLSVTNTFSQNLIELCFAPVKLDALMFVQLAGNLFLGVVHVAPVLNGQRDEDLYSEQIENRDALFIVGSAGALVVKLFQMCLRAIFAYIDASLNSNGGSRSKGSAAVAAALTGSSAKQEIMDPISNSGSIVTFMYFYIKMVSRIQRKKDVKGSLRLLRWIFSVMSPVKVVNQAG